VKSCVHHCYLGFDIILTGAASARQLCACRD